MWLPGEKISSIPNVLKAFASRLSDSMCFSTDHSAKRNRVPLPRCTGAWSLPYTSGYRAMRDEQQTLCRHHRRNRRRGRCSRTPHFYHCCRASAATIQPCPCCMERQRAGELPFRVSSAGKPFGFPLQPFSTRNHSRTMSGYYPLLFPFSFSYAITSSSFFGAWVSTKEPITFF